MGLLLSWTNLYANVSLLARIIRDFKIQRRDGDKNVAYKVNLSSFSVYTDYSYPLTLSIVGEPS